MSCWDGCKVYYVKMEMTSKKWRNNLVDFAIFWEQGIDREGFKWVWSPLEIEICFRKISGYDPFRIASAAFQSIEHELVDTTLEHTTTKQNPLTLYTFICNILEKLRQLHLAIIQKLSPSLSNRCNTSSIFHRKTTLRKNSPQIEYRWMQTTQWNKI